MSHPVATIAVAAGVSLAMILITDRYRPKGARVGDMGKNGEDTLVFDASSAPKK